MATGQAWIEDQPAHSFGGDTAATAVMRLLRAFGIDPDTIEAGYDACRMDRQVFRVGRSDPCPDCRGSGRYVGLTAVEPCSTCGGAGRI